MTRGRRRRRPRINRAAWPPLPIADHATARDVVRLLLDREAAADPDPYYEDVAAHFVVKAVEYALDLAGTPVPPFGDAAVQALHTESNRCLYEADADIVELVGSADLDVLAGVLKVDLNDRVQPGRRVLPRFAAPGSEWLIARFPSFSDAFAMSDPSTWVVQRVVGDFDIAGPEAIEVVDSFAATWVQPRDPHPPWAEITPSGAERLLTNLVHNGWSGRARFGSRTFAENVAAGFVGCFGADTRYFSNLDTRSDTEPLFNATRFCLYREYWWDGGVIALNGRHIGHHWIAADPP